MLKSKNVLARLESRHLISKARVFCPYCFANDASFGNPVYIICETTQKCELRVRPLCPQKDEGEPANKYEDYGWTDKDSIETDSDSEHGPVCTTPIDTKELLEKHNA